MGFCFQYNFTAYHFFSRTTVIGFLIGSLQDTRENKLARVFLSNHHSSQICCVHLKTEVESRKQNLDSPFKSGMALM